MNLAALAGSHPGRSHPAWRRDHSRRRGGRRRNSASSRCCSSRMSKKNFPGSSATRRPTRPCAWCAWPPGFGRRAVETGVRNVAEYLAHERGDLVPRAEAEDFYRGVERLREDLDRLEARARLWSRAPRMRRRTRDEAARHRQAHRNPARAGATRAGRVRARHAPVSAAALPVPAFALDLGGTSRAMRRAPNACAKRSRSWARFS